MKRFFSACLTMLPVIASAAAAIGNTSVPTLSQPLPDMPGVVSWNTLAKVKQINAKNRIVPEFTPEIAALNDKEVKLQGFMMPLDPGKAQKHFLLSVNPATCPYCMPAGPEGVVEVKAKTPVKYSFEPVLVSGKMSVLKNDPSGIYYRLSDAAPLAAK